MIDVVTGMLIVDGILLIVVAAMLERNYRQVRSTYQPGWTSQLPDPDSKPRIRVKARNDQTAAAAQAELNRRLQDEQNVWWNDRQGWRPRDFTRYVRPND